MSAVVPTLGAVVIFGATAAVFARAAIRPQHRGVWLLLAFALVLNFAGKGAMLAPPPAHRFANICSLQLERNYS